jgi:methionyl-tRNA formyltransferase
VSETKNLRLVVMGTGPFAVPMLRALYDSRHSVVALVTQPPRDVRGKPTAKNPMRVEAEAHGTPVFDPQSINTDEARATLRGYAPDLFVVADYGQILKPETLATARLGGVNLHGSLLPKYRGAAPINWALYHGDPETGVTVIQMSPRVDAGGCLAKAATPIRPDENAVELEHRLAELGAPLVRTMVDRLAEGTIHPEPQDQAQATPARRLKKTDGEVDWTRTAAQIKNQVRALEPWPRTATSWLRAAGEPMRLILGRVDMDESAAGGEPGTVVGVERDQFTVATGGGRLVIREVQPSGKRMLSAGEFLRGYPLRAGERLGPAG